MQNLNDFIKNEADCCVKCGLCLPHCPTYLKTKHEGESPRGRIALLQGIATGELTPTLSAKTYLDHCLSCGACEAVCPVPVKYGRLLTAGRAVMSPQKYPKNKFNLKLNLKIIFKKAFLFILPRLYWIRNILYSQKNNKIKPKIKIGLLPGCLHRFFEQQVFTDSIKILNYFNLDFSLIQDFKCCGGLHLHAGDQKMFEKLNQQNQILFEKFDLILSTASGCTAVLKEYAQQNKNKNKIQNITDYINNYIIINNINFNPENININKYKINIKQKILIHTPCTACPSNSNFNLKIFSDQAEIIYLKHRQCCGASGTYFLEYPDMAEKLAGDILEEVKQVSPDIFLTSNIGCAIHLGKQFKKHGIKHIKILHPVNLLAEKITALQNIKN